MSELPPVRSPKHAAVWAAFFLGGGQLYNKQLEKAVLLWIWAGLLAAFGVALLLLGGLGRALARAPVPPPLGDWIAENALSVTLAWVAFAALLWAAGIRDAWTSAERINRGECVIRYSMREQWVHVVASQLLGLLPFVGFLFPPGAVAEAWDAARERRRPDGRRLLREGGQALLEWAVVRIAVYLSWALAGLWVLWWLLRALRLAA